MVEVIPFKGLIYNKDKIINFANVIAPPYDVINDKQKTFLKNLSQYNIVNLTLPEEDKNLNKYQTAQNIFSEWLRKKILKFDSNEYFYIFEENYNEDNICKKISGFIGLLKIQDYGQPNGILRHENTLSKPKEDRLNLLRSCRANFEFIYTLYDDKDYKIASILEQTKKDSSPKINIVAPYDSNLNFRLWKIFDSEQKKEIVNLMKPKTLLIADGHHRYETSLLYKKEIEKVKGNFLKPEDYILSLFISYNQKDVSIHPTHRVIKFQNNLTINQIINILSNYFNIEEIDFSEDSIKKSMQNYYYIYLKNRKNTNLIRTIPICICDKNEKCYLAVLNCNLLNIYKNLGIPFENSIEEFEFLDVNILHKFIIENLLKNFKIEEVSFFHNINEVKNALKESKVNSSFGFILNNPDIETIVKLANKGMLMPQKSTYFYPKPCSGLVIYKF